MNNLTPFVRHELDNLPDETHGLAGGDCCKDDSMESHCIPCRQKNALDYLAGDTPGVMAFYSPEMTDAAAEQALQPLAPTKTPKSKDLAAESDETVLNHVEWREDAPYG